MGQNRGRLKVLVSAYACAPHCGSEPEVGWAFSRAMAEHHDVWVLTRAAHRARIEAEMAARTVPGLHFLYYDPPEWFGWGRRGGVWMQLHSWLWQFLAVSKVRNMHQQVGFDVAHHVTFAKYWAPSLLAFLDIPFVWGPVGGAEHTPTELLPALSLRGRLAEGLKRLVSRMSEFGPAVRRTARRASVGYASTDQTAVRLRRMGCRDVRVRTQIGIHAASGGGPKDQAQPFRFISIGRLIDWKGFELGLRAFMQCGLLDAEYWVVGSGPNREKLERLSENCPTHLRIRFFGSLPTDAVANRIRAADVLIHPSFHDSAGMVCLEALTNGVPVICLDTGGPAGLVDSSCGIRVSPAAPDVTVDALAKAMRQVAEDEPLFGRLCAGSIQRVKNCYLWDDKAAEMATCYQELLQSGVDL